MQHTQDIALNKKPVKHADVGSDSAGVSGVNKMPKKQGRGRPCSFDRDELLEHVMNIFWEHGFSGMSFNEIAQKTGLTRASLYNSFESKQNLLLEAVSHYFKTSPDNILRNLKPGDCVGDGFRELFEALAVTRSADPKNRGCMGFNCIAELMHEDSDLGRKLKDMYVGRQNYVRHLIGQAVNQGELPADTDVNATGDMVFAFLGGFNVFSKAGSSEGELRSMYKQFLKNLGF